MATDAPATVRQLEALKKTVDGLSSRVDKIVQALNDRLQSIKDAEDRLRQLERLDVARLERMMQLDAAKLMQIDTNAVLRMVANEAREIAKVAQIDQRLTALHTVVTRLVNQARP